MKRQPKPFAIEIKRSRRPTHPNAASESDFLQKGTDFLETVNLDKVFRAHSPAAEPELIVPAFLQPAKENLRPLLQDAKPAETPKPSFWKQDCGPASTAAIPRILPSLNSEDTAKPTIESKPEAKDQVKRPALRAIPRLRVPAKQGKGLPAAPVANEKQIPNASIEPISALAPSNDEEQDPTLHRARRRTFKSRKADQDSSAALPPGQRWKRRLHIRAR